MKALPQSMNAHPSLSELADWIEHALDARLDIDTRGSI
jgi:hypothetical protein